MRRDATRGIVSSGDLRRGLPRIRWRTARGFRARGISVLAASNDAGRRLANPRRRSRRVSPERFILADSIPPRRRRRRRRRQRRLTGVMMLFSCSSNSAPTQKAEGRERGSPRGGCAAAPLRILRPTPPSTLCSDAALPSPSRAFPRIPRRARYRSYTSGAMPRHSREREGEGRAAPP